MPKRKADAVAEASGDRDGGAGNAFTRLMKRPKVCRPWSYHTGVVPPDESSRMFSTLSELIKQAVEEHGQPKVVVRGQSFDQRRLVAYCSRTSAAYGYSGARPVNAGWPDPLPRLAEIASSLTNGAVFDSALCNLYRDGQDTIGMHRDKEAMDGHIVSFSFYPKGATERDFVIFDNDGKRVESLKLANGSVLVMKPGMQQQYMHSLPARAKVTTARVNVTLRQHPDPPTKFQAAAVDATSVNANTETPDGKSAPSTDFSQHGGVRVMGAEPKPTTPSISTPASSPPATLSQPSTSNSTSPSVT